MPLELDDIKRFHDKAYSANQVTREQSSDDLVFYWITQWDDQLLSDSQLAYRGEFNILRKAGRQIMADLRLNPVQPDFHPKDEAREDDAELMDGLYRADDRKLATQEAYDYATQDAVVCGFGAWEMYTEYATNQVGDSNQVIKRRYIPEANNTCFFDPNATHLDKSDANYVSVLYKYSEDGYKDLVHDLTGEDIDKVQMSQFDSPEQSYAFPWTAEQSKVYVVSFFHREKVKDKVITFEDPLGQPIILKESSIEELIDDLVDGGYTVVSEKEIERWQITKYIASGNEILSSEIIAGENLPIIPCYGEHVPQIEGEEYWCGITRLAKDPQRLRNFQMSYLADIVSRSPRPKPIFAPEQIEGFEFMYEENGADNNYPYLLQNRTDGAGNDIPLGPLAVMPEQTMPQALAVSIDLTRQAVEDVANPGISQDVADPDLSGKAVIALQSRMDQQSYIYQHNAKHAKKRDAEVYASIASQIHDTPKKLSIQTEDGTLKSVDLMRVVIDEDTGEPVTLNDLTNMEFDVYADIGQTYQTQKQQTLEQLTTMSASLSDMDPLKNILTMKALELMPGVKFDDVRDYARKQLIALGIKEPETEEEIAQVQAAAQQPEKEDPVVMLERMKEQTAQMTQANKAKENEIKIAQLQLETEGKSQKLQSDILTNARKLEQEQEKIDNAASNDNFNNALSLLEMEIQAGKDLNQAVINNNPNQMFRSSVNG